MVQRRSPLRLRSVYPGMKAAPLLDLELECEPCAPEPDCCHEPASEVAYEPPPRPRPTMISAKYRHKEERRKVLKMSVAKLRRIEDPESALRRSVLINNTVRRLQKEARQEKMNKQQNSTYPRCFGSSFRTTFNNNLLNDPPSLNLSSTHDDFPIAEPEPIVAATTIVETTIPDPSCLCGETLDGVLDVELSRKRSLDEDDCDVHDVLSQFYMPPTPRMITSIDEDDDIDVETVPPGNKSASSMLASLVKETEPARKRSRLSEEDEESQQEHALADPTNMLEDFKDEVYLRNRRSEQEHIVGMLGLIEPLLPISDPPRTPLSSANAPLCVSTIEEDALRTGMCGGRRYSTPTGHDRENIAPKGGLGGLSTYVSSGAAYCTTLSTVSAGGTVSGTVAVSAHQQPSQPEDTPQQPYSCGHSSLFGDLRGGVVFHGLMASMES